jgi:hypothetical protein
VGTGEACFAWRAVMVSLLLVFEIIVEIVGQHIYVDVGKICILPALALKDWQRRSSGGDA